MPRADRWTDEQVEMLRTLAASGDGAREIARRIGRPVESVQAKARTHRIGISRSMPKLVARQRINAFFSG